MNHKKFGKTIKNRELKKIRFRIFKSENASYEERFNNCIYALNKIYQFVYEDNDYIEFVIDLEYSIQEIIDCLDDYYTS